MMTEALLSELTQIVNIWKSRYLSSCTCYPCCRVLVHRVNTVGFLLYVFLEGIRFPFSQALHETVCFPHVRNVIIDFAVVFSFLPQAPRTRSSPKKLFNWLSSVLNHTVDDTAAAVKTNKLMVIYVLHVHGKGSGLIFTSVLSKDVTM